MHIYTIFDTYVFLRSLGKTSLFRRTLEHLHMKRHILRYSTEIEKEYTNKAGSVGFLPILTIKLQELKRSGKFKKITKTNILKARKKIKEKELPLPADRDDVKFIEAGLASKSKYLVTTDRGMLVLDPYRHNSENMRIIKPAGYVAI